MHRARQGAGAVKKLRVRRTTRLPARGWGCGDGCWCRACWAWRLAHATGETPRPRPRQRPGAVPHTKRRRSRPAPGKRDRGSSFEAFRGLPVDRSTVSTRQPPPAGAPDARGGWRGESRGRSVEVRPSRPAGPHRGSRLRFRSAVCVSTAVAETRPTRPRIRPRLRERGNAAPRRGTRLYY